VALQIRPINILSYHAEQAVDLYTNLFEVRPGSSFSGQYQPSGAALARQAQLVTQARNILQKNKTAERRIEEDFQRQMDRYRAQNNDQPPTDTELVDADFQPKRETFNEYFAQVDTLLAADIDDDAPSEGDDQEIDNFGVTDEENDADFDIVRPVNVNLPTAVPPPSLPAPAVSPARFTTRPSDFGITTPDASSPSKREADE